MSYFDDNEDRIIFGRPPRFSDDEPRTVECKRCGSGGLQWSETDTGWTLIHANGRVHVCDEKRVHQSALDDFEVQE